MCKRKNGRGYKCYNQNKKGAFISGFIQYAESLKHFLIKTSDLIYTLKYIILQYRLWSL